MGGSTVELDLSQTPTTILIAGLQGSGETTFSGKLARLIKSKGKRPLLVAGDVYRPAAIDQLKIVGEQVGVPVHTDYESKDPVGIAQAAIARAKQEGHNVVIIDTAGRLAVDEEMMKEIAQVKEAAQPQEILFVVDSMKGRDRSGRASCREVVGTYG